MNVSESQFDFIVDLTY